MGKVKTVVLDTKGNLVELKAEPDVVLIDVKTGTLKKEKPKKKGMTRRLGRGARSFNRGGKV